MNNKFFSYDFCISDFFQMQTIYDCANMADAKRKIKSFFGTKTVITYIGNKIAQ